MRRTGTAIRPRQSKDQRRGARLIPHAEEIVRLYEEGFSGPEIADRFQSSYQTVLSLLRSEGVTIRTYQNARHGQRSKRHYQRRDRIPAADGYMKVRVDVDDPIVGPMAQSVAGAAGYVLEHRLVMARHLGRPLLPSETVHHINGVHDDNAIGNLQLRSGRHGKGVVQVCLDCGSRNVGHAPIT